MKKFFNEEYQIHNFMSSSGSGSTTLLFFVCIMKATDEKSRIWIRSPVYGSKDPNPYKNVTDPEHCLAVTPLDFGT
jgi:hypothetical protein